MLWSHRNQQNVRMVSTPGDRSPSGGAEAWCRKAVTLDRCAPQRAKSDVKTQNFVSVWEKEAAGPGRLSSGWVRREKLYRNTGLRLSLALSSHSIFSNREMQLSDSLFSMISGRAKFGDIRNRYDSINTDQKWLVTANDDFQSHW